jgi:hypothetical protein
MSEMPFKVIDSIDAGHEEARAACGPIAQALPEDPMLAITCLGMIACFVFNHFPKAKRVAIARDWTTTLVGLVEDDKDE